MSRPMVVTAVAVLMLTPPNHGSPHRWPSPWRLRAGEEPFHSITNRLRTRRDLMRGPLPLELRQVARRRVRILLECFLVFRDFFEHGSGHPPEQCADLQILVR